MEATLSSSRIPSPSGPGWSALAIAARAYIALVVIGGGATLVYFSQQPAPAAGPFLVLLACACLMSAWKVALPISVANGSTLSLADAANVMSLLLLGPHAAVVIVVGGVLTQCVYRPRQRYPAYRTVFSMAAAALTMAASAAAYTSLGGVRAPATIAAVLDKPLVGALAAYFVVNTTLIAGAIALSTNRTFLQIWRDDFLWSAASFMVAGSAGALGAVVVAQGEHWKTILLLGPIYVTYRTYEAFVGRLDFEQRHTEQMRLLHQETVAALRQAREAERALADEKERLAGAITEMMHLEELQQQLLDREQAARQSAEAANRLKDQFLAVVSHELRTPLNAILGWADMLCRRALDAPVRERAARTIRDSAKRQAQLIDDLLDVARISSGKLRLDKAIVDLRDVVLDAVQVLQPGADLKGITLTVEMTDAIDTVYGDASRLQQVAWNLLSNAVKFTPEGGTVRVRLRQVRSAVELSVSDTGQGITPEFLPSVFEPFRQADASSTRIHPGLGLGLSIVKSLVEAHSGTIEAQSGGEGCGATFIVRLPAVFSAPDSIPAFPSMAASGSASDQSLDGISVLVVDDDRSSLDVVVAHLQHCGAHVITAGSAPDAREIVEKERVDVLLADIGMPGEDGYSLIRRIRTSDIGSTARIPAAALTALARREDRQQALQAGFQLHLTKPVDPRSLVAAVTRLHRLNA